MTGVLTRRGLLGLGATGILGLGMTGASPLTALAAAPGKKFRIALSNSYIGNKWRIEMENVFKAALDMEPFRSEVEGSWFNSGNDVSKQSQQISDLIARKVDAIVVDAASPTGLNGILTQASGRGILVVSFDNIVTAPSALKVNTDQVAFGRQLAELARQEAERQGQRHHGDWRRRDFRRRGSQQGRRRNLVEESRH